MDVFKEVIRLLMANGSLPSKYRPHKLKGKYAGKWECHICPDWLLVWDQNDTELTLLLIILVHMLICFSISMMLISHA